MPVKEGDFIQLRYTGSVDGEIFDTTEEEKAKEAGMYAEGRSYEPITIRIGGMHTIPGLEEAVVGKEIGDEGEVDIPCEKAYGPRDESLIKSAPLKNFEQKPTIGTVVSSEGREGRVINILGKRAIVDFNHPLAGKELQYTFKVVKEITSPTEKTKSLIKLFSGKGMDLTLSKKGVLTVILPPGIQYDRQWMMGKGMIVHQIFEYIEEITEIVFKEIFKKPSSPDIIETVEEETGTKKDSPEDSSKD